MYVTVDEIRNGAAIDPPLPTPPTDAQITASILKWQAIVEKITRQFFEPRLLEMVLDGPGSGTLHLSVPIIEVNELYVNDSDTAEDSDDFIAYDFETHNGLGNPKIVLKKTSLTNIFVPSGTGSFLTGKANQKIIGTFGYVNPDSESFKGVTTTINDGATSPDELSTIGSQTTRSEVTYEVEITAGGAYSVFEAKLTVTSGDNAGTILIEPKTFISGEEVEFDQGLRIVFTRDGTSVMVLGDKWSIVSKYDGVPLPIKDAMIKLVLSKDYPDESGIYPGGITGVLSKERTDGHELKWSQRKIGSSEFMGLIDDEEILTTLMMYKGPRLIRPSSFNEISTTR